MSSTDLWRYCTTEQSREMVLSLQLFGERGWADEKVMACLYALSNHSETHYRFVRIPKRNGKSRTLLVPDALLKGVQRRILHHILDGFASASSATAYRKGSSVTANAAVHAGKKVILKLDIQDFFGSITFPLVLSSAFSSRSFPPSVGVMLTMLCCYRDYLPQGAPTSPAISNLVMRPFDIYMEQWCEEREIAYSRYCDDMTFSGDFDVMQVRQKAGGFLRAMGFELNSEKTRILRNGVRQTVTGIVVNDKPQLVREYRRKLRQEIYYCEKFGAAGHLSHIGAGCCQSDEPADPGRYLKSLLGKINYVLLVNPDDAWFLRARGRVTEMIEGCREEDERIAGR